MYGLLLSVVDSHAGDLTPARHWSCSKWDSADGDSRARLMPSLLSALQRAADGETAASYLRMVHVPVRKPTVTTMSRSEYYLRRAEECERQDATAKLKSSREDFLSAAVLWRKLAAMAAQREATVQTQRSRLFGLIGGFRSAGGGVRRASFLLRHHSTDEG